MKLQKLSSMILADASVCRSLLSGQAPEDSNSQTIAQTCGVVPKVFSVVVCATIALIIGFGQITTADASLLNPLDFASDGPFPTVTGTYSFNTTGPTPTLTVPGGSTINGLSFNGVAVFTFDYVSIHTGMTLVGSGSQPLALLSQSSIVIDGNGGINVGGQAAYYDTPGAGGPGGGAGGFRGTRGGSGGPGHQGYGPGGGYGGSPRQNGLEGYGGGGGGFGGGGGNGGPSGTGGAIYGDLAEQLLGGSGGGGAGGTSSHSSGAGGGGGGSIEIGAIGSIQVGGSGIFANGGAGGGGYYRNNGGGGSGGGIFLHAGTIMLSSTLSVVGGNGRSGGGDTGGGGGGGGRIVVMTTPGGFFDSGSVVLNGGVNGGGNGVFTVSETMVPEPSTIVLLAAAALGSLAYAWRKRRRTA